MWHYCCCYICMNIERLNLNQYFNFKGKREMKKLLGFLCAVTLVFGMAGVASAIPYTDTFDAGYMHWLGWWGGETSVSWTFDITDDGFNPVTQDVTSAEVALNLQDDSWDFWEFASLHVGTNYFIWEVDTGTTAFTVDSLMTLSDSGTIDCTLTANLGDFYFNTATLSAEGTEPSTAPVPEPSTVLLVGTGLLGIVAFGRKQLNKKA